MTALTGHCHCGAVRASLDTAVPVGELPLRACQCGFCRRHGGLTTGDPDGALHFEAAPGAIAVYRFGLGISDVLLCAECGTYVGMVMADGERLLGVLNVRGTDMPGFEGREPDPHTYDHETPDQRIARRRERWTPATLVEAAPSA